MQAGQTSAQQEAAAWQQNAQAWSERLLAGFAPYHDLLQPVCLAVLELCTGFSILQHAAAAAHPPRSSAHLASAVMELMTPSDLQTGGAHLYRRELHACMYQLHEHLQAVAGAHADIQAHQCCNELPDCSSCMSLCKSSSQGLELRTVHCETRPGSSSFAKHPGAL